VRPGFKRHELRERYDVLSMCEDEWHEYCGLKTAEVVRRELSTRRALTGWLLNAGAGVYELGIGTWKEISVDLFTTPIRNRTHSICTTIENLPFRPGSIDAIVCVGEVLAYCDPVRVITEFARTLVRGGLLICDFHSSRSARYWFTKNFGRAADLVVDVYNGKPERTWVYDPAYIEALLRSHGFRIERTAGTHVWSAFARRCGLPAHAALVLQRRLEQFPALHPWADVMTIVASQSASST
jgi:SAM-dependent methyltransferase